jgi:hypothetical protein
LSFISEALLYRLRLFGAISINSRKRLNIQSGLWVWS